MQVLKLGLAGAESTLPTESRSFVDSGNALVSVQGRSADGTLHEDFINSKRSFTINYAVVSEATKDILTAIYQLQIDNGSFLSFIYTNQAGSNVSVTVRMAAPNFGAINPKDVYYYYGVTINLEEV